MKISHKEFARLLAAELGIDEKIANVHLLGLVSEINRVVGSGEAYTIPGFGSFTADDENRPLFLPDIAFAAEINFAFEGMPEVDVEAARTVVDEDMEDFFDEPSAPQQPSQKSDTLIVDEDVMDEDDPFNITEPDDVITPRLLEMMGKKAKSTGGGKSIKKDDPPAKFPETIEETTSDDVFGLDDVSTDVLADAGAEENDAKAILEHSLSDDTIQQEDESSVRKDSAIAPPDPFDFLSELDEEESNANLPNEGPKSDVSGIQADSDDAGFDSKPVEVNDPDSFQESTDAEEDIAADTKHSITPPPPDNAIFESEDSNGDNQDADILTEIRTDEPEDTPSDDPFYIPEDSQTLAAVSKIAELQNEAEGQETEQEEEVYKPTLSEDFKVGNISGKKGKKNSGAVSDSKGRKKETSGKNQASPILWILLLAATILIGFGVWWYLTQTQVQPWPTAGELPVAGLSQAMTDEIPAGLPPESETMVDEAATAGSVPVDDAVLDETPVAVTQPDAPAETAAPTTTATSSPTSSAEEGSVVQAEQPATARQAPPTTGTASTEFGLMGELQSFNQPVYGIVIHSLASREEGNFICREIREQGIRCSVVQATTSAGRVTYRVALGQFEYVAHAQQAISDLPRQYQREGIWPARIN